MELNNKCLLDLKIQEQKGKISQLRKDLEQKHKEKYIKKEIQTIDYENEVIEVDYSKVLPREKPKNEKEKSTQINFQNIGFYNNKLLALDKYILYIALGNIILIDDKKPVFTQKITFKFQGYFAKILPNKRLLISHVERGVSLFQINF